jgi:hypothetical protein
VGQKCGRDGLEGLAVQLRGGVHGDHAPRVDGAREPLERGPGPGESARQVQAVDEHRCILGKVAPVVGQHPQAVAGDLGVGGVDVHDVDLVGGQGLVGDAVIQAPWLLGQAVGSLEARPAVAALEELMGQPNAQAGVGGQVADPGETEGARPVLAHCQGIGVVEAQRHRYPEPQGGQAPIEGREVGGLCLEELAAHGARVVRIEIDAAGPDGRKEDGGVAQAPGVGHLRLARRAGGLGEDLAQDVRLGEAFGADDESLGRHDGGGEDREQEQEAAARETRSRARSGAGVRIQRP